MSYILEHTVLYDNNPLDFIAAVVPLLVAIIYWIKIRAMKKEEQMLESRLAARHADVTAEKMDLGFMDELYMPEEPKTSKE